MKQFDYKLKDKDVEVRYQPEYNTKNDTTSHIAFTGHIMITDITVHEYFEDISDYKPVADIDIIEMRKISEAAYLNFIECILYGGA